jgi:hypothetical protein
MRESLSSDTDEELLEKASPVFVGAFADLATARAFIEQFGGTLYASHLLATQ